LSLIKKLDEVAREISTTTIIGNPTMSAVITS
jgi:hypothetical protein